MKLKTGERELIFENGGVQICKDAQILYFNRRPMYAFVKTDMAVTEFFDREYDNISEENGRIKAEGILATPTVRS